MNYYPQLSLHILKVAAIMWRPNLLGCILTVEIQQDYLDGADENDRLYGETESNRLIGECGDDYLLGDAGGTDCLDGSSGNDCLDGGDLSTPLSGGRTQREIIIEILRNARVSISQELSIFI
ncbi:hypothetical protein [Microseira wollei]|nr:hypothetical protein [Microseira wollei]